ncbi:MAG: cyclic nucleotide-binding domain-containing protein [Deltaproteobacteria bacterium]|nr:cyclic nucleotide-binding domain-containing protein [Deltaproteobacteria bacterium]MCB9785395.1 cyclic nucleotide-binding domain-containing protein [Deltaproteobacteria bacterium]
MDTNDPNEPEAPAPPEVDDPATKRKVSLLLHSRYFHALAVPILERIARVTEFVQISGGEVLIQHGEKADAMYVLEEGVAEVFAVDTRTGSESLLRRLTTGACFGEVAFLTGQLRAATVRARTDCSLLKVGATEFQVLMDRFHPVAVALSQSLAQWLYEDGERDTYRFVKLATFPVQPRAVSAFTPRFIKHYKALPVHRDDSRVIVAMTDPTDLVALDAMRQEVGRLALEVVVVSESDLERFVDQVLPLIYQQVEGWVG